jgi:lysophospholipase L1-like esterase
MVEKVVTSPGEITTVMFTTNVRYPDLGDGRTVSLKPREIGHFNLDKRLTIEFNGDRPCTCAMEITPNDSAITVFLAGNSTVTDQRYEPWSAWGQMLPRFFKPGSVSVANHAESGEALKSFIAENRLEKLMGMIRPGDYLFIQFAHNDQKPESSAYVEAFTGYKEYLKRYIDETRRRGANPVLVTAMLRRNFNDLGEVINTHGDYPAAMRQVSDEENVPLIDLFEMSRILYEALGPEDSRKLFVHYPAGN